MSPKCPCGHLPIDIPVIFLERVVLTILYDGTRMGLGN